MSDRGLSSLRFLIYIFTIHFNPFIQITIVDIYPFLSFHDLQKVSFGNISSKERVPYLRVLFHENLWLLVT